MCDEETCEEEIAIAWNYCLRTVGKPGEPPNVTGGQFQRCLKGQISAKCGGSAVDFGKRRRK